MTLRYIFHSGFLVETARCILVFDYWMDPADVMSGYMNTCKHVYVFSSHFHEDHFTKAIFKWKNSIPNITYILSKDILKRRRAQKEDADVWMTKGAVWEDENLNNCPDFTVAFATKQTMVAADFVGIVSAKNDADKMAKTGWKSEKSENVNAPVFTDFPMTLECRIKEKIDESEEGYYIVAEIVNILVDENYLAEDGKPDMEKMELIVFDPIHHGYIELGKTIGKAFSDGKALK